MKNQNYIFFLIFIMGFISCNSTDTGDKTEEFLIGIWTNDTGQKYQQGTEIKPIISQIHFKESFTYDMESLNLPEGNFFPLFIKPDYSGKWKYIKEEKLIEFSPLYSFGPEFDKIYYWEIMEMTENLLHIKILEQDKTVFDQRVFIKEK